MKKELCVKLVIYKGYTEMHGQQDIKLDRSLCKVPVILAHCNET